MCVCARVKSEIVRVEMRNNIKYTSIQLFTSEIFLDRVRNIFKLIYLILKREKRQQKKGLNYLNCVRVNVEVFETSSRLNIQII